MRRASLGQRMMLYTENEKSLPVINRILSFVVRFFRGRRRRRSACRLVSMHLLAIGLFASRAAIVSDSEN